MPEWMGSYMAGVVGLIAMPASLVFSPDAYYFGVLPVLAETAQAYGIPEVAVVRASLIGQMTVGFPLSPLTGATYLLIGLADVDLGEHIKFTFSGRGPCRWSCWPSRFLRVRFRCSD